MQAEDAFPTLAGPPLYRAMASILRYIAKILEDRATEAEKVLRPRVRDVINTRDGYAIDSMIDDGCPNVD